MWPFTRKYHLEQSGLMHGFVDFHSHVLAGVDDGIRKPEDSLKVLEEYERLGVDTLWITPHVMEDMPNTTAGLRMAFRHLQAQYSGPVKLKLASENMLDNLFEDRIAKGDVLPIGDKQLHLLVETSYFTPPNDFDAKIARVFSAGYFPLLAHPERYIYMDYEYYDLLHERGIKMQLNLSSLFGFYGKEARNKAQFLLENEYYNAIGTDTHRVAQVKRCIAEGMLTRSQIGMLKEIPGIE